MKLRAKDKSPIMEKLQQVFDCMEGLGISIQFGRYGDITIIDAGTNEREAVHWDLKDIDNGQSPSELPPMLDYKLTKEATDEEELAQLHKVLSK